MKTLTVSLTILWLLTPPPLTSAAEWGGFDSPDRMSKGRYSFHIYDVPEKARLTNDRMPWSDTYWPTYKGGIAFRYQGKKINSWSYRLHTRDELKRMSVDEIAFLSPAEKFDIWMGDYSYPTVRRERARTSPRSATWAGLCHGWVPAALNHREPLPRTVINPDGIRVAFGSSDIKAILTFYYGKVDWKPHSWTGTKCSHVETKPSETSPFALYGGCDGVNAATVHLTLTNSIGRLNEGFVMDRDRGREIWNQPFYAYEFKQYASCPISTTGRRKGAVRGVMIKMIAEYVDELDESQWAPEMKLDPRTGLLKANSKFVTYRYCLELGADDSILAGEWYSKTRPGYIWNHGPSPFTHPYWGRVKDLIQ